MYRGRDQDEAGLRCFLEDLEGVERSPNRAARAPLRRLSPRPRFSPAATPRTLAPVAAAPLPQACQAANISTAAACKAYLTKKAETPPVTVSKPASNTIAAPTKLPVATTAIGPNLPADCVQAGATTDLQCRQFEARKGKGVAGAANTPGAQVVLPSTAAVALPPDCVAARATSAEACKAFEARKAANAGQPKGTPNVSIPSNPSAQTESIRVSPDCVTRGITTQAQCDLFHAKLKGAGSTANTSPAATNGQPLEPVRALPKGVSAGQVAPLLDSAKQLPPNGAGKTAQSSGTPVTPPSSDKAAQASLGLDQSAKAGSSAESSRLYHPSDCQSAAYFPRASRSSIKRR